MYIIKGHSNTTLACSIMSILSLFFFTGKTLAAKHCPIICEINFKYEKNMKGQKYM